MTDVSRNSAEKILSVMANRRRLRCSDLMICKDLLEAFPENDDNQIRKELCDLCTSLLFRSISYLDRLEAIWQNWMFSGSTVNMQHDINRISMLVTEKLKDLLVRDLYLSCGLPAIGMDILLTDNTFSPIPNF